MIVYTNNDKNLVVPSSLGNISTGSGGSGVTPEDVEIMIDQAIDTYDEGIQGQFNSTNTAVSGNTENIEAISAETQSIANDLDSLGNSVENLSAVTSGISNDLSSLGNDVEELSGVTSGIATDLETLSAYTANLQDRSIYSFILTSATSYVDLYSEMRNLYDSGKRNILLWGRQRFTGNFWVALTVADKGESTLWFKGIQGNGTTIYTYNVSISSDGSTTGILKADGEFMETTISKYTLPTASSSTLGGIKVGSGLTIDGNGVLSTDGGGGDSNYVIVDALSAVTNPVEGMIAYRNSYSYQETIPCYKVQRKEEYGAWGDLFRVIVDGNEVVRVYQDGGNFIWDWTNDGEWHYYNREYNGNIYPILYRTYNDYETQINSYFIIEQDFGGLADIGGYLSPEGGDNPVCDIEDYNYIKTVLVPADFYQYIDGEWQKLSLPKKVILDEMTDAERAALFTELLNVAEAEETKNINDKYQFFATFDKAEYVDNARLRLQFQGFYNNEYIIFSASFYSVFGGESIYGPYFKVYNDGHYNKGNNRIDAFHMINLHLLRDEEYVFYDGNTYTGYTIDASAVNTDTFVVQYPTGEGWSSFLIYKDGNDDLKNRYSETYPDDDKYRYYEPEGRCGYFAKRTGQTMTVVFSFNGPTGTTLEWDANASYTAATDTVNYWGSNNSYYRDLVVYTGDTCSPGYQFEEVGTREYCEGTSQADNKNGLFPFRIASGGTGTRLYVNPVVYFEKIPTVTLYDENGEPHSFDEKFAFNYADYTVSLIAKNNSDYRYARFTITAH